MKLFTLLIACIGLCLINAPAYSATCSSINIARDQSIPVGKCRVSDTSCTSNSQCSGSNNGCVFGACSDNGDQCTADSDCNTNETCEDSVTFTFDTTYTCGQYANGDWWVEADTNDEVEITDITPPPSSQCSTQSDGCRNGWGVNPLPDVNYYNDSDSTGAYENSLYGEAPPSLPYTADASTEYQSVVKAISSLGNSGSHTPDLLTGAVLTIVPNGEQPASGDFRPPFYGPLRPTSNYNTSDLELDLIPSIDIDDLTSSTDMPGKSWTARALGDFNPMTVSIIGHHNRVMPIYGHIFDGYPRNSAGGQSYSGYHANTARIRSDARLRLLMDDMDFVNDADDKAMLYDAVQTGIDLAWGYKNHDETGVPSLFRVKTLWPAVVFSAFLLDDDDLTDFNGWDAFAEASAFFDTTRYGEGHAGDHLWGFDRGEANYWNNKTWSRDPHGYAEAAGAGSSMTYQWCCAMGPWQGGALLQMLLQAKTFSSHHDFTSYFHVMDRYWNGWDVTGSTQTAGVFNSGDPCENGGGSQNGPAGCSEDGSCDCDEGTPVRTKKVAHGNTGGPGWVSPYTQQMWDDFRECADPTFKGVASTEWPCSAIVDRDSDGTVDSVDNCRDENYNLQTDDDDDGYGNACDCDHDNDGDCDQTDMDTLTNDFCVDNPNYDDGTTDCTTYGASTPCTDGTNRDGVSVTHTPSGTPENTTCGGLNYNDLLRQAIDNLVGATPGPSGYSCAGTTPCP